MSTRLESLSLEHLRDLRMRPDHQAYVDALGAANASVERTLVANGGLALVAPEGVVACAGVTVFWEGAGQMWMRAGVLSGCYPVALARHCRVLIRRFEDVLRLRRIQATVKADNEPALRFIRWLGFRAEGLLRGYGPEGADYIMFARVRA